MKETLMARLEYTFILIQKPFLYCGTCPINQSSDKKKLLWLLLYHVILTRIKHSKQIIDTLGHKWNPSDLDDSLVSKIHYASYMQIWVTGKMQKKVPAITVLGAPLTKQMRTSCITPEQGTWNKKATTPAPCSHLHKDQQIFKSMIFLILE